jgi:hypothetical protein
MITQVFGWKVDFKQKKGTHKKSVTRVDVSLLIPECTLLKMELLLCVLVFIYLRIYS